MAYAVEDIDALRLRVTTLVQQTERLRERIAALEAIVRAADEMRHQAGTDMAYLPEAEAYDAARKAVEL